MSGVPCTQQTVIIFSCRVLITGISGQFACIFGFQMVFCVKSKQKGNVLIFAVHIKGIILDTDVGLTHSLVFRPTLVSEC